MKKIILLLTFLVCVNSVLLSQENIALSKTVSASSTLGNSYASNVNDGKTDSRWESVHGQDNQWIQIDLEDVYDLTSTNIIWEGASAQSYEIEVSPNNRDWRNITSKTDNTGARTDNFDFVEDEELVKEVRYVRLNLLTRTTIYGFSIYEWEIYGTPSIVTPIAANIEIKPRNVTLVTEIPDELNILSLNNSLIDYNDQTSIFNQLAASGSKTAKWTKQTRLGQSLRYHYEEGEGTTDNGPSAKMQVRSKAWTHIILQEQSNKPLTDPADFQESVKLWMEYIKNYCPNPNAKIILTLNWAYTDASDFSGDTENLYANYKSIAKELGVTICPVGNAYNQILTSDGLDAKNALYTDNRHPSTTASYLSACMLYATLFDQSPVGLSYYPSSIGSDNATRMQTHAWNSYQIHEDVVDDINGMVRFSYSILDQFNRSMTGDNANLQWGVEGGGNINNGIFVSNGEEGIFQVTVQVDDFNATANVTVAKAYEPVVDDYFAEIDNETGYSQDFDAIGTEAITTLPQGWRIEKRTDAPRTIGMYCLAVKQTEQSGGNNIASDAKNGIYNFGAGDASVAVDRAVGGISTSVAGGARCVNTFLKIRNTGTSDIKSFDIEYDVEKYRKGANAAGFTMQMYYSEDGENWTSAGEDFRTFFSADDVTLGYASVPGDIRNVNAHLYQKLNAGNDLYLAWNYSVTTGTEAQAAQALALDNVVIRASDLEIVDYAEFSSMNAYKQDFDNMGPEATALLPIGWKIEKRLDTPRKLGSFASAVNQTEQSGGNDIASNAKNGIYNFGAGDASTNTDRAIGGISTGIANGTRCVNMYLKIRNTGSTDINDLEIKYDVEKYRQGTNSKGFIIQMYYSPDGESWTSAGDDFNTFFNADNSSTGYASVPGNIRYVNAYLNQRLEADNDLYLAWNYSVADGTDAQGAQALAIDNVEIKSKDIVLSIKSDSDESVRLRYQDKILTVEGEDINKIVLYNINGALIATADTCRSFDVSVLPTGVYFVKVIDSNSNIKTFKVLI